MNIEPDYKTGISKLNYFIENNLQNYIPTFRLTKNFRSNLDIQNHC